MPINQKLEQETLSDAHLFWLEKNYENVTVLKVDLSETFGKFVSTIGDECGVEYAINDLAKANSRSRLRMMTLYQIAQSVGGLVVGTGNKVEDYGIGFYTKYGDGGIDIAPIADLYKTEVRELGRFLGVIPEIIDAKPTDGLWDDGRTDEDQIGATYEQLEEQWKLVQVRFFQYCKSSIHKIDIRLIPFPRIFWRNNETWCDWCRQVRSLLCTAV